MKTTRRRVVLGSAAGLSLAAIGLPNLATAQTTTLKISHQFPGGTLTEGDFRDRLCRKFAAEVDREDQRRAQVRGLSRLVAGEGELAVRARCARARSTCRWCRCPMRAAKCAETNIGLMPGLVTSYEQAYKWKNGEVGKLLSTFLARQGHRARHLDLAGRRRREPRQAAGRARRREGHEGPRRQPRNGHDPQGRRRLGAVAAVERDLRGDADRRDGRRHDVVDQPHLVPAGGSVEGADHRRASMRTGSCSSRS